MGLALLYGWTFLVGDSLVSLSENDRSRVLQSKDNTNDQKKSKWYFVQEKREACHRHLLSFLQRAP